MSQDTEKTVVEINGVKMELDLRTAKRVEELRIGDKVKVLIKQYSDTFNVHPGVIIGFEPFEKLPTIVIAYAIVSFSDFELKFLHYNAKTEDHEVIKALDDDVELDRTKVMQIIDRKIAEKEREISSLSERKDYFLSNFGKYWEAIEHEKS